MSTTSHGLDAHPEVAVVVPVGQQQRRERDEGDAEGRGDHEERHVVVYAAQLAKRAVREHPGARDPDEAEEHADERGALGPIWWARPAPGRSVATVSWSTRSVEAIARMASVNPASASRVHGLVGRAERVDVAQEPAAPESRRGLGRHGEGTADQPVAAAQDSASARSSRTRSVLA